MDAGPYRSAFLLLRDDIRQLTAYVEPTDDNLSVYSHRLYEILLRASTEFESLCREQLASTGYSKPTHDQNINDYRTLEASLHLEACSVGVHLWRPTPRYVKPFLDWSTATPPLHWYDAYNQVKHNRNTNFPRANLGNALSAVAGLFVILCRLQILPGDVAFTQVRNTPDYEEHIFPICPELTLVLPK